MTFLQSMANFGGKVSKEHFNNMQEFCEKTGADCSYEKAEKIKNGNPPNRLICNYREDNRDCIKIFPLNKIS